MANQFLRKASLVVSGGSEQIELSALRFTFKTRQWDLQTPNNVSVRVFNLKGETANKIQKEFSHLTLQAGYQDGAYGIVFDGTIVQVRRGREDGRTTYLDITAADGDAAINFGQVNTSLQAGSTFKDRVAALAKAMEPHGVTQGYTADLPAQGLPRGKVMYGMARDHLRDLGASTDTKWSVQDGKLQVIRLDGYLPGDAVVLNSNTGMIGLPEQTEGGITVRCLLNPLIKVGGRVQIDNTSVQKAALDVGLTESALLHNAFLPSVADDGFYRVIVAEHEGDSRGQPWYTNLICLTLGEGPNMTIVAKGYS